METEAGSSAPEGRLRFIIQEIEEEQPVKKEFKCPQCSKVFREQLNVQRHLKTHTNLLPYPCSFCKESFKTILLLTQHLKAHCGEKISRTERRADHVPKKNSRKRRKRREIARIFNCLYCKKTFSCEMYAKRHIKNVHRGFPLEMIDGPVDCVICQKSFGDLETLKEHVRSHDAEAFECAHCGKRFFSRYAIRRHVQMVHIKAHVSLPCPQCDKVLRGTKAFLRHQQSHSNQEPFKCCFCPKKFKLQSFLDKHLALHIEERPGIPCGICGCVLKYRQSWKKHMRMHESVTEDLTCSFCKKKFIYRARLETHQQRYHKYLECPYCDKKPGSQKFLEEHIREHHKGFPVEIKKEIRGEKPDEKHKLTVDSRASMDLADAHEINFLDGTMVKDEFTIREIELQDSDFENPEKPPDAQSELVQFVITEFRERDHKCPNCDMAFYEASHLRLHMVKHRKVETFHCRQCFKSFKDKDKLRTHLKSHGKVLPREHKSRERRVSLGQKVPQKRKAQEDETFRITGYHRDQFDRHAGERLRRCKLCREGFYEETELEDHMELIHIWYKDSMEKDRPEDLELICGFCGKRFKTKYLNRQHIKLIHSESRDIKCYICSRTFPNSIWLHKHLRDCQAQNKQILVMPLHVFVEGSLLNVRLPTSWTIYVGDFLALLVILLMISQCRFPLQLQSADFAREKWSILVVENHVILQEFPALEHLQANHFLLANMGKGDVIPDSPLVDVGFSALSTLERLLQRMNLHVTLQILKVLKHLTANCARDDITAGIIGKPSVEHVHVTPEAIVIPVGSSAVGALERLVSVSHQVLLEIVLPAEGLAADLAAVGLRRVVHQHVSLQVELVLELLAAHRTLFIPHVAVHQQVPLVLGLVPEHLLTLCTLVADCGQFAGLLALVNFQDMSPDACFVSEVLAANRTLELPLIAVSLHVSLEAGRRLEELPADDFARQQGSVLLVNLQVSEQIVIPGEGFITVLLVEEFLLTHLTSAHLLTGMLPGVILQRLQCLESLFADCAHWRIIRIHRKSPVQNCDVFPQALLAPHRRLAVETVDIPPQMRDAVLSESGLLLESFATHATDEGLVLSVHVQMLPQIPLMLELLRTQRTLNVLRLAVHGHVSLEESPVVEDFLAVLTREALPWKLGMNSLDVTPHVVLVVEGSSALFAFKLGVCAMPGDVAFQGLLSLQEFSANCARKDVLLRVKKEPESTECSFLKAKEEVAGENGPVEEQGNANLFCHACERQFYDQEEYDVHQEQHMQCPYCEKWLPTKRGLKLHVHYLHSGLPWIIADGPQRCTACGKTFKNLTVLQSHAESKHQKGRKSSARKSVARSSTFQITMVDLTSDQGTSGRVGQRISQVKVERSLPNGLFHAANDFHCRICGETFRSEENRLKHVLQVHEISQGTQESVSCSYCNVKCRNSYRLELHIRESHRGLPTFIEDGPISRGVCFVALNRVENEKFTQPLRYACTSCGEKFAEKVKLKSHILQMHGNSDTGKSGFPCNVCGAVLQHKLSFERHLVLHDNSLGTVKCPQCPKSFLRQCDLDEHLPRHSQERPFKCSDCSLSFKKRRGLQQHRLLHDTGPTMCPYCTRHCLNEARLRFHVRKCHRGLPAKITDGPVSCTICKMSFDSLDALMSHATMLHATAMKPCRCKYCGEEFLDHNERQVHIQQNHDNESQGIVQLSYKSYRCDECGKVLSSKNNFERHVMKHKNVGSFECTICPRKFAYQSELRQHVRVCLRRQKKSQTAQCPHCLVKFKTQERFEKHMMKLHPGLPKSISGKGHIECSICEKSFDSLDELRTHAAAQHPVERPVECRFCGETFQDEEEKRDHIDEVHRRHICDVCKRFFDNRDALLLHMETHETKKNSRRHNESYECEKCGEMFSKKLTLKIHMFRRHLSKATSTEKGPFPCKICGKVLAKRTTLKLHVLRHEGSLKFECSRCSKTFQSNVDLRKHVRTHNIRRIYKCRICGKGFKGSGALGRHAMVHENPPKECPHCGMKCRNEETFHSHMTTFHRGLPLEIGNEGGPFDCGVCGVSFKIIEALQNHCSAEHPCEKPFKCMNCQETFSDKQGMEKHFQETQECQLKHALYSTSGPFTCNLCGKVFIQRHSMESHMVQKHNAKGKYKCSSCNREFAYISQYKQHQMAKRSCRRGFKTTVRSVRRVKATYRRRARRFECKYCDKVLRCEKTFKHHIKCHKESGIDESSLKYECEKCGQRFIDEITVKLHILRWHVMSRIMDSYKGSGPFTCKQCGKVLIRRHTLRRHLHRHANDLGIKCPLCPKSYMLRLDLREHIASHSKDKAFKCGVCGQAFKQKRYLMCHKKKMMCFKSKLLDYENISCPYCMKEFKLKYILVRHLKRFHRGLPQVITTDGPFRCYVCQTKSETLEDLKEHCAVQHPCEKPIRCHKCGERFTQRIELSDHMQSGKCVKRRILVHRSKVSSRMKRISARHACNICGKVMRYHFNLERHMIDAHAQAGRFQCEICSKQISHQSVYTVHMKRCMDSRYCAYCSKLCWTSVRLVNHVHRHHQSLPVDSRNHPLDCIACEKSFGNLQELNDHHKDTHYGEERFECVRCKITFDSREERMYHFTFQCRKNNQHIKSDICCNICGMFFRKRKYLELHMSRHEAADDAAFFLYECEKCGQKFNDEMKVKLHIFRIHLKLMAKYQGNGPFTCKDCGSFHVRKANFELHLMRHETSENFPCYKCPMKFLSMRSMEIHMKYHSRTYKCEQCGKKFKSRGVLRRHTVRHEVENAMTAECPYCGIVCESKSDFHVHVETFHRGLPVEIGEEGPFSCSACEQTFDTLDDLQAHCLTEHPCEKPFDCKMCQQTFVNKTEMQKHTEERTECREIEEKSAVNARTEMVPCTVCGKEMQASSLANHMVNVHGIGGKFECQFCLKKFLHQGRHRAHVPLCRKLMSRVQECDYCAKKCKGRQLLVIHVQNLHPGLPVDNVYGPVNCKLCGELFESTQFLISHANVEHPVEKPFECKTCGNAFASEKEKEIHVEEIHPKQRFPCPICGIVYARQHSLGQHVQRHEKDGVDASAFKFECEKCGQRFSDAIRVKNHILHKHLSAEVENTIERIERSSRVMGCLYCGKECINQEHFMAHINTFHRGLPMEIEEEGPFYCSACPKIFKIFEALQDHCQAHHPCENPFRCNHCQWTFARKLEMEAHLVANKQCQTTKSHSSELTSCEFCGIQITRRNFEYHIVHRHGIGGKFECQYCAKRFLYQREFGRHENFCRDKLGWKKKCPYCPRVCKDSELLTLHVHVLHPGLPVEIKDDEIQCVICKEEFKYLDNLMDHAREQHPVEKPFECQICGQCFVAEQEKSCHMKEKHMNSECELCGKNFSCEKALSRHLQRHKKRGVDASQYKFKCEKCGLKFRREIQVKFHILRHHVNSSLSDYTGKAPYTCKECGKIMQRRDYLERHLLKHGSTKGVPCEKCGKLFLSEMMYTTHMKNHAKNKAFNPHLYSFKHRKHVKEHTNHTRFKQCCYCDQDCQNEETFHSHMTTFHRGLPLEIGDEGGPFDCGVCGVSFKIIEALQNHCSAEHPCEKPFKCMNCQETFSKKQAMMDHFQENEECYKNRLNCRICAKRCNNQFKLLRHIQSHGRELIGESAYKYECEKCGQKFSDEMRVKLHVFRKHSNEKSFLNDVSMVKTQTERRKMSFLCKTCGQSFTIEKSYLTHIAKHTAEYKECPYCGLICASEDDFLQHLETFHRGLPVEMEEEGPFNCGVCEERFKIIEALIDHCLLEHPCNPPFTCLNCHGAFSSLREVADHLQQNGKCPENSTKTFDCDLCGRQHYSIPALKRHLVLSHNIGGKIKCQQCPRMFTFPSDVISHTEMCHKPKMQLLECPYCGVKCENKERFVMHVDRLHTGLPIPLTEPLEDGPVACIACGEAFECLDDLKKHASVQHLPEEAFECKTCGETFVTEVELDKHIHEGHSSPKFTCIVCKNTFEHHETLLGHLKRHEDEGIDVSSYMFECEKCGLKFTEELQMQFHYFRKHVLDKMLAEYAESLACKECGKVMASRLNLEKHFMLHDPTLGVKCPKCPRRFLINGDMVFHSRRHNKNVPFTCRICQKAVKGHIEYIAHCTSHTTGKLSANESVECPYCGLLWKKNFSRERFLDHMRKYHRGLPLEVGGPFECRVCKDLTFDSLEAIKSHCLAEHPCEMPFRCKNCQQMFGHNVDIERHLQENVDCQGVNRSFPQRRRTIVGHSNYCRKCGKIFDTQEDLLKHKESHAEEFYRRRAEKNISFDPSLPYECEKCHQRFQTEFIVKVHIMREHVRPGLKDKMKEYSRIGPFTCKECGKVFTVRYYLEKHLLFHDPSLGVSCPECPRSFLSEPNMLFHMKSHRSEPKDLFECKVCGKKFIRKANWEDHMSVHDNTPQKCQYCQMSVKNMQRLKIHIIKYHPGLPHNAKDDEPVKCRLCKRKFNNLSDLKHHTATKHPLKKAVNCTFCRKKLDSVDDMVRHMEEDHGNENTACNICGQVLVTKFGMTRHMEAHAYDKTCPICSKRILRKYYQNHLNTCQESQSQGSELCPHCPAKCISREVLEMHVSKFHTGLPIEITDGPLECTICRMSFAEGIEALKDHVEVEHMEINLFDCERCEDSFSSKEQLYDHIRAAHETHDCAECGEKFSRRIKLEDHIRRHHRAPEEDEEEENYDEEEGHGEDIWTCQECGKSLYSGSAFKRHMARHAERNGDVCRPANCLYCDQVFKTSECLAAHVAMSHWSVAVECRYCSVECTSRQNLRYHVNYAHTGLPVDAHDGPISPLICNVALLNMDSLLYIKQEKPADEEETDVEVIENGVQFMLEETIQRSCSRCGDVFTDEDEFNNHVLNHGISVIEDEDCY
ncbi:uncharacterized protein LOC132255877 [Phlebotomus argentipes]|uniref:uncharacterized protein LOC132255877 n=1 Tax=Phlebotomus argentipes TaxID=94469 RepID=UPI002892AB77|nr:uncharacterized protein LOC132255877 [Phlebotomus argentipes]